MCGRNWNEDPRDLVLFYYALELVASIVIKVLSLFPYASHPGMVNGMN